MYYSILDVERNVMQKQLHESKIMALEQEMQRINKDFDLTAQLGSTKYLLEEMTKKFQQYIQYKHVYILYIIK